MTPGVIGIELGASAPFHAAMSSSAQPNAGIRWSIAGAACTVACGLLDTNGNYTAPQILPAPATVTLTAQSVADSSKQASATVTITSNFSLQLSPPSSIPSGASGAPPPPPRPVPGPNP